MLTSSVYFAFTLKLAFTILQRKPWGKLYHMSVRGSAWLHLYIHFNKMGGWWWGGGRRFAMETWKRYCIICRLYGNFFYFTLKSKGRYDVIWFHSTGLTTPVWWHSTNQYNCHLTAQFRIGRLKRIPRTKTSENKNYDGGIPQRWEETFREMLIILVSPTI